VIPARYDTVQVQRVVNTARTETIVIPAQFGTIERRTQTSPEKAEWRQVLCEANASPTVIRAIQRALQTEGFYKGALDGSLGRATYAAVEQFQASRGLSTGGLTLATVDALGVNWRSMVSGNQLSSGGFTSGGVATGGTSGFTTGTTVSTTGGAGGAAAGYTIGSDNSVRNASGVTIGTLRANGDVVNSAGQVILRGLSATGGSATSGSAIGGSVGGLNTRSNVGRSGGTLLNNGTAATSSSAGDFTVRADGSVVNTSGAVIGRVNANGEIISNGQVIGRVRPRN
jgi:peptidoglycan hydrolase-like protein with peptidoglycan-binding domain